MAYDIIGDVHGHSTKLKRLLRILGYQERKGIWSHPSRMAIFVGDFIDRGPGQIETLRIVRGMVDAGNAHAVMGNHELNAIGFATGGRPRTPEKTEQHRAFLDAIAGDSAHHDEWVNWFLGLPLWLDLGEIRVVHACWDAPSIHAANVILDGNHLKHAFVADAFTKGHRDTFGLDGLPPEGGAALFHALEHLLKGPEIELPETCRFPDKNGHLRTSARTKWWLGDAATMTEGVFFHESMEHLVSDIPLPAAAMPGHDGGSPIIIGHYWMTGTPAPLTPKIACVDYSAGNGGPLVAYRSDGETQLSARKFMSSD